MKGTQDRKRDQPRWQEGDAVRSPTLEDRELIQVIYGLEKFLGRCPTMREIGRQFEPTISRQAVYVKVVRLRSKGYVERGDGGLRFPGVVLTKPARLFMETVER